MSDVSTGSNDRVTVREVYTLVGQLGTRIEDLRSHIDEIMIPTEHRLTSVEENTKAVADELRRHIDSTKESEHRITAVEAEAKETSITVDNIGGRLEVIERRFTTTRAQLSVLAAMAVAALGGLTYTVADIIRGH